MFSSSAAASTRASLFRTSPDVHRAVASANCQEWSAQAVQTLPFIGGFLERVLGRTRGSKIVAAAHAQRIVEIRRTMDRHLGLAPLPRGAGVEPADERAVRIVHPLV